MFDHWLEQAALSDKQYTNYSWAKHISTLSPDNQQLQAKQLVLIGFDKKVANAVREALWPMSWAFSDMPLMDMGNVRKKSADFVIPFLKEVMDSQLFPIIIGAKPDLVYAQFQSFLNLRDHVSLSIIDERTPISLNKKLSNKEHYLNKIVYQRTDSLFHLGIIGSQAHFTDPALIHWLEDQHYEYLRLGQARQNLEEVEPLIRDADLLGLNMDVLKQAEAPGQLNPSPSGLFLEEACQLARYGGMSDKLRSFSIYGINGQSKQKLTATAQAAAQLIWYFTEGFYHRKHDFPASNKGLTEYVVDWKGHESKLTFWKSPKSGRWWLQLADKSNRKLERHRLVPCSYEDYVKATREELPDRLWNAFRRF